MTIYDELKPIAAGVMEEFHQGIIKYVGLTEGAGPIDEPGEPTRLETKLDATSRGATYKYVSTGFAVASDLLVTAAVVDGLTVKISDFISIDGIDYKIMHIDPLPAAGVTLIWKFIVRKGG